MKLGNCCILCTDKRNLQSNSTKAWLVLFKNGNNLYEHWKNKTSEPHRFKLDLTDKLNLKNPNKNMALANLIFIKLGKTSSQNTIKFKISAPTWNDTFDLPDGSYSIANIQDYFEFIIKKHETLAENPPIQIYPNKIKNDCFQNKDWL